MKWKIENDPTCKMCQTGQTEDLYNFNFCPWNDYLIPKVHEWLNGMLAENVQIDFKTLCLGLPNKIPNNTVYEYAFVLIRYYIHKQRAAKNIPSLQHFKAWTIEQCIQELKIAG